MNRSVLILLTYLYISDSIKQGRLELGILRSFEFVSELRRTSVIVRQFGDNGASVFVKGAPECMKEICHANSCE